MHYTFDLISCLIFTASIFVLIVQKGHFSKGYRAFYPMVFITGVYLLGAMHYAFTWHQRTGKVILESFYEFDLLYFVCLTLILGFMTLYFTDMCVRKVRAPYMIFLIPTIVVIIFVFFNRSTGIMFNYDENGIYHRGPWLWTNYVIWAAYYITMIVMVIRARNRLGSKTAAGFLLFFAFEFGLQVYQFFMVEIYTGGIAFTMGLLYLVMAPVFLKSSVDDLTNLYNRYGFKDAVVDAFRYEPNTEYCIATIDIYKFAEINERFGFDVGNKVLIYMNEYLNKLFPNAEAIARFSSDHFFLCLKKEDMLNSLPSIQIQDIVPEIKTPYVIDLFAGVYNITDRSEDVLHMCDRAAFALLQIKGNYNQQVITFDENAQEEMRKETYIMREMNNAINQEKFTIYLQPTIDANDNSIVAAEALVRWKDENYGMISPGEFIPLFENNGSIITLDLFVCKKVCEYLNHLKELNIPHVPISINISKVDILSETFVEKLIRIFDDYNINPSDIRIELTETAFAKSEDVLGTMDKLHQKGFLILMDDFGSGYSTFNTFADYPIDILKVDMGFMSNLVDSKKGQNVFESIVTMANKISIPIIVEGVETNEQLRLLQEMGINYIQGYLFSKPVPKNDFNELLKNGIEVGQA